MGNAPPHGNSRDDPHQGQGGPYNMNDAAGVGVHHHQNQQPNQNQKQYPYHNHQQSQASSSSQQHQQHHPYNPTNRTQMNYNSSNMPSSNSDASMSNVEDNQRLPSSSDSHRRSSSKSNLNLPLNLASLSASDDDTVPTVFRWEHGGRQVYITGTFNGWSRQIPMHRSGNDFTYIHNLKRGKHAFKFIVDDEWRFAPDQPTVADIEGRINNFIDVTDFKAYTGDKDFEREKAAAYYSQSRSSSMQMQQDGSDGGGGVGGNNGGGGAGDNAVANAPDTFTDPDGEVFTHNMPDLDEYTKDPPPLPPHLRHIILNKPPQLSDTAALPVPQHVALNHLYCTAIKDNMMVLGITQRFRTKFVTTVYYSPELSK
jgi:5'-AMP-activated protein kinase regulatory beta subunit